MALPNAKLDKYDPRSRIEENMATAEQPVKEEQADLLMKKFTLAEEANKSNTDYMGLGKKALNIKQPYEMLSNYETEEFKALGDIIKANPVWENNFDRLSKMTEQMIEKVYDPSSPMTPKKMEETLMGEIGKIGKEVLDV